MEFGKQTSMGIFRETSTYKTLRSMLLSQEMTGK